MMMIPRKRNEFDLLDAMFGDEPFFTKSISSKAMRTDIKEKSDKFLVDIDLPGYNKEDIKIEIKDGYLNVHAETNVENDDNDDEGTYVRQERFFGECSRNFYIGDEITEEDVKASFKNGTLHIEIPKKDDKEEIPEKKYIQIDD